MTTTRLNSELWRKPISNTYQYWLALFDKGHGYAGQFNYSHNGTDKKIVEETVAMEWARSLAAEYNTHVSDLKLNDSDPPDVFCYLDAKKLGVELVQFVDGDNKQRATRGESQFSGKLFVDTQWSDVDFTEKTKQLIQSKGEKYKKNNLTMDALVIFTGEPWLFAWQVSEWLSDLANVNHPNIKSAYFLMSYEAGRGVEHWPLFKIYGTLGE